MINRALFGAAAAAILACTFPAIAGARHVVELFTSQGCSSCPPADRVLQGLASRPGVIALGFHVDYWDSLGWKDTLDSSANTTRQQAYASHFGSNQVYTPQAVVDGEADAVGSNSGAIAGLMKNALPVDVAINGKTVSVGSGSGSATLWRVDYTRHASVKIARGENRGSTIAYVNAVRGMTRLGAWSGKEEQYSLGSCGGAAGADACAVLLQSGSGTGRILGAAGG